MDKPIYVGSYRNQLSAIVAGDGFAAVPVWVPQPAIGSATLRGSRVHAIVASSNLTLLTKLLVIMKALAVTKSGAGEGGNLAFGTATTITRSDTSQKDFVKEGWRVGDRVAVFDRGNRTGGLTTAANRKVAQITGVAAGTLTFAAATWTAEAIPSTAAIHRVSPMGMPVSVSAGAGNSAAVQPANILSTLNMPWLPNRPDTADVVGPDEAIIAMLSSTNTVLGAGDVIEITATGGDY
ncbi:hypothetical protein SAMN05428997_1052 [Bosea sp. CRIB-10]|uniref:hypothetical protein n=1 Tax=Bosea sp. CRIB-10 TaxID=378404 RepID=UPI0008E78605|nr:hypothetical protein [Bosea sp. CRIB-10]SFC21840.1 hypothetical protein SAMN05428997_1052 [Bosea sp. CRIB-10]